MDGRPPDATPPLAPELAPPLETEPPVSAPPFAEPAVIPPLPELPETPPFPDPPETPPFPEPPPDPVCDASDEFPPVPLLEHAAAKSIAETALMYLDPFIVPIVTS